MMAMSFNERVPFFIVNYKKTSAYISVYPCSRKRKTKSNNNNNNIKKYEKRNNVRIMNIS